MMISRMIWVIHCRCSRTALRSIGDAIGIFSPVCSILYIHHVIRQQNNSDIFFIHDLIRQQGMWLHVNLSTFYMLSTRHYTIIMTSSRHHHDIVKTSPLRPRYIDDICLSHAKGSPTITDSKSTSLTVC